MSEVALVTGAARGIGGATAVRLAEQGFSLVLVDRCANDPAVGYDLATRHDLDEVSRRCESGGSEVIEIVGDVRDPDCLEEAVAAARERFGGLDVVVTAAGVLVGGSPTWELAEEVWTTALAVNLGGLVELCRRAVPLLLQRPVPRRGRIVAIASAGSFVGLPLLSAYVASKHAVAGVVRTLAAELGEAGITVNAVAPGSTRTEVLDASASLYGLSDPEEFASHHLLARLIEPDEVASLVSYLCTREAGGVTGAVIPIDAGMTAR